MSSQLLQRVGEALYGPRWQSELARDLDVHNRTVRRWVAGDSDIPAGVRVELLRLLAKRAVLIDRLLSDMSNEWEK